MFASPSDPTRRTAFVAGVFYLLTFVGSIPAALLLGSAQVDPTFALTGIPDGDVRLSAVLELLNALTAIGTAVAVFSIIRRHHEGLALGFVATRLFEAATIVIGIVMLLSIATLRETGSAAAETVVPAFATVRFWSLVIGPGMASFNALMFATALFRSGLVPRGIPALGLIGAPLFIAFVAGTMLGITGPGTIWQGIAVAPFFIWELAIGLWMTFKGFRTTAPIVVEAAASPQVALATKAGAA
jgi:hypothetical protein